MPSRILIPFVLMQYRMDVYLPVVVHCISLDMMRVDSPGLLMSYTMSRMPSMITRPMSGVL